MHKTHTLGVLVALLFLTLSITTAFAALASYTVVRGDTFGKIATKNQLSITQLASYNKQIKNINMIYPGQVIYLTSATTSASTPKPTVPKPATTSPTTGTPVSTVPAAGESRFIAYTTGYGWPDNTPAGGAIALPVIHSTAGGTGTFSDPITMAVGHVISGGKSTPDYPKGTKFYIPTLRKYFIVEDLCGDGGAPQNGPCHTGYQGMPWLDVWVGGQGIATSLVYSCQDTLTDTHLVIKNPASNYMVVSGAITGATSCAKLYGDTVVTN